MYMYIYMYVVIVEEHRHTPVHISAVNDHGDVIINDRKREERALHTSPRQWTEYVVNKERETESLR